MTLNQAGYELEDRGVVVVVGNRKIGHDVALKVARMGAKVIIGSPVQGGGFNMGVVSEDHASGIGDRVIAMQAEILTEGGVDQFFDAVMEELGEIRVLVDIADSALALNGKLLVETSLADWNAVLSSYLRHPFLLSRRVIMEFLAQGNGGRIIYISHLGGSERMNSVCTTASCSALQAFIRSVAKEYGDRSITCNGIFFSYEIDPGAVTSINTKQASHTGLHQPQQLVAPTKAIAELVSFLISEEASFVNGEVIHLRPSQITD